MKVTVWGCRGSLPAPGPEKIRYGGNTSCVQVVHQDKLIVLDGGSGIQRLGRYLERNIREVHILLTHLHIDHTMGLGFFLPLYNPEVTVHIYGPSIGTEPLLNQLRRYFSPPLFPLRLNELPTHPVLHEINETEFSIGEVMIRSGFICHPGPTLGYRLTCGEVVVTYMPDHEVALGSADFPRHNGWTSGYDLALGADLLLHDAQFDASEYKDKIGWGHSSIDDAIRFAELCGVKHLSLFHHDPARTDDELDALLVRYTLTPKTEMRLSMCREGDSYELV